MKWFGLIMLGIMLGLSDAIPAYHDGSFDIKNALIAMCSGILWMTLCE